MASYTRIAQLKDRAAFLAHAKSLGIAVGCDEEADAAALAQPCEVHGRRIGNRFCILPMEGWDGTPEGAPTELVARRWRNFGRSGAKLIWGGEAAAVRHDGRANPRQLLINDANLKAIEALRGELVREHAAHCGGCEDLLVGLQLTHSGRFCKPNDNTRPEPVILYRHPLLDRKFNLRNDHPVMTDGEIDGLIGDFVAAARRAQQAGFGFVDVKHCHGYLGHEFLSAVDRPGRYGGPLENRTRFLREVVLPGIRREAPGLIVGVRLSVFDFVPFQKGPDGIGEPMPFERPYRCGFGADRDNPDRAYDLAETHQLLELFEQLDIRLVCTTAGSPYYNPHIQRPAMFPPSDGYLPPEDPLAGVARQLGAVAELKQRHPGLLFVGCAYTYLQEFVGQVAGHEVRCGRADFVGLGRMVLSYPELPADVLAGRPVDRKRLCRTFSDCTTAPRHGMVSGCYPLDSHYRGTDEARRLDSVKKRLHTEQKGKP